MQLNLKSKSEKKGKHFFKKGKEDPAAFLTWLLNASEDDIPDKVQNMPSKDLLEGILYVLRILTLMGDEEQ